LFNIRCGCGGEKQNGGEAENGSEREEETEI